MEAENAFTTIYKNGLFTIEETHYYPGNLKISFKSMQEEIINPFILNIMHYLKEVLPFEEIYVTHAVCAGETCTNLYPWTDALRDRLQHPSRYSYPAKSDELTEKLRKIFSGKFQDQQCEKLVKKNNMNPLTAGNILRMDMKTYFLSTKKEKNSKEAMEDVMEIFQTLCEIKFKSENNQNSVNKSNLRLVKTTTKTSNSGEKS